MASLLHLAVVLLVGGVLAAGGAQAAGPSEVALADRATWPGALDSRAAFDQASRAEILTFLEVLGEFQAKPETLGARLGVKKVHADSVTRWTAQTLDVMAANLKAARVSCGAGSSPAVSAAEPGCSATPLTPANYRTEATAFAAGLPDSYRAWHTQARAFYQVYVAEQLRLAALFPGPTSEVLTWTPGETNGMQRADLHFLLTFDDGPTGKGGNTDTLLAQLSGLRVNGVFFVLGDALERRLARSSSEAVRSLYRGQCLASHGRVHQSHSRLETWKASIDATRTSIQSVIEPVGSRVLFRPPYGQRTAELATYVEKQGDAVMLWNIDSQDWHAKMSSQRVADRIVTLMLLWRRGIILFHDVHPKVQVALPEILKQTGKSGVVWDDCRKELVAR